jgi:hypothetical protein
MMTGLGQPKPSARTPSSKQSGTRSKAFSNLLIADKPVAVEALRDWIAAE